MPPPLAGQTRFSLRVERSSQPPYNPRPFFCAPCSHSANAHLDLGRPSLHPCGTGRGQQRCRAKKQLQVVAALFQPPAFQPENLTFLQRDSCYASNGKPPFPRKYTLTHNDLTGALKLSVASDYNYKQISGFYTRILRDEIVAQWVGHPQHSLHICCHVSGEERWLASPYLRSYIFRREMGLVLETFLYGDRDLFVVYPELLQAEVYIRFQSHVQELDTFEFWGILGDPLSWKSPPSFSWTRMLSTIFNLAGPSEAPCITPSTSGTNSVAQQSSTSAPGLAQGRPASQDPDACLCNGHCPPGFSPAAAQPVACLCAMHATAMPMDPNEPSCTNRQVAVATVVGLHENLGLPSVLMQDADLASSSSTTLNDELAGRGRRVVSCSVEKIEALAEQGTGMLR